jgi:hypothetical protein
LKLLERFPLFIPKEDGNDDDSTNSSTTQEHLQTIVLFFWQSFSFFSFLLIEVIVRGAYRYIQYIYTLDENKNTQMFTTRGESLNNLESHQIPTSVAGHSERLPSDV